MVTQADKPVGRKQKLTPPPVKIIALEHCIPVFQPEKLSSDEQLLDKLKTFNADLFVTVAYGQILKQQVLDIPKIGVLNLHASILPAYRGAAPINWMLINGEENIGVSTMFSDKGVDTGPVIDTINLPADKQEDAASLSKRMSIVGSDLLLESLLKIQKDLDTENPDYKAIKEKFSKVQLDYDKLDVSKQLAPFLTKELGRIDFAAKEICFSSPNPRQDFFKYTRPNSAENIHNLVRGTQPWPGSYFMFQGEKIAIIETQLVPEDFYLSEDLLGKAPAEIIAINHKAAYVHLKTQDGILQINKLKPAGKKEMKASDCLNGLRLKEGDFLL